MLFVASGLLVCQRAEPVIAQDKVALEKQIISLKQKLQQAETQISTLKTEVNQLKNANAKLTTDSTKKPDDKSLKDLQTIIDGYRGAGLVHVVILKLKDDSPTTEPQSLIDDTYSQLSKIKTVRGVWAGKPAEKGTPDANKDFTVALVFVFDNADALKTYLNDSVHTKFADKHLKKWETPLIYDFEPKKPSP
jgi:hypothetical protein